MDGWLEVPSGQDGLYIANGMLEWDDASASPDAGLLAVVSLSSTPLGRNFVVGPILPPGPADFGYQNGVTGASPIVPLVAGDTVKLQGKQNSGGALNVLSSSEPDTIWLALHRVGDIPS